MPFFVYISPNFFNTYSAKYIIFFLYFAELLKYLFGDVLYSYDVIRRFIYKQIRRIIDYLLFVQPGQARTIQVSTGLLRLNHELL